MSPQGSESAPAIANAGSEDRMSHQRWMICALLFLATVIAYVDRGVIAYLKNTLESVIPGLNDVKYGMITAAFPAAYAHRHGGGRRPDRQAGYAQGFCHRHRHVEHRGHAAGRGVFSDHLCALPCFCSAWAKRRTFPPASRRWPSGFPSGSARWLRESSTPAPMSATLWCRWWCRSW